jgi:hemolysin III
MMISNKESKMEEAKNYTQGEEFANAFTHAIGAMFAIYAIVMLAVTATTPLQKATTAVYGAMMFILFQSSTCYHAITNEKAKRVFRKIDHSAIYLMIAGTYTPLLMMVVNFPNSVALMSMTWYLAVTGIVFSCITLKFKYLSTGLYLLMGWLSIFLVYNIWIKYSHMAIWFMLAGGLCYTLGSVFYLSKKKFAHTFWHLCVLAGAVFHYFCILELLKG